MGMPARPSAPTRARFLNVRWLAVASMLALAPACGLRTDPRPPEETAPVVEGEVTLAAKDGGIEVTWRRAERSVDGRRLYDLAAFVVERAEQPGEFAEIARIDVIDQEKLRRKSRFRHVDRPAVSTGTVWYRVRAVTEDGETGPPSQVAAVTLPMASPPDTPAASQP